MLTFVCFEITPLEFLLRIGFLLVGVAGLPLTDCEACGSHLRIIGLFVLLYPFTKVQSRYRKVHIS